MLNRIAYLIKIAVIVLITVSYHFAFAEELIQDKKLEQEAQDIFKDIKCLVCNGQSIADSNSDFSYNLRNKIRAKLKQGMNKKEIEKDLISVYGEEITFITQVDKKTIVLWIFPCLLSLIGILYLFKVFKMKEGEL